MAAAPENLLLRFTGTPSEIELAVPAAALARALDGMQRIVHLIGMRLEGRTLSRRARPSQDVQRRFILFCEPPVAGSYVQPVRLATLDPNLLSSEELGRATADLDRFLRTVGAQDELELEEAVPDPAYRRFMLDAVAEMIPDPASGLSLEIASRGRVLLSSVTAYAFVEIQRRPRIAAASAGVVNGELTEIDFAGRRITLRLLGLKRDIRCSYEDAVEATLVEHPRELIQVFGSVALDDDGIPKTIEAVEFIRPIRDEELPIELFVVDDRPVVPRAPLSVAIRFDREEQLFTATIPEIGVETAGETRDEVADAVTAELRVLWRLYAREDDGRLAPGARQLKQSLHAMFSEAGHAA